MFPSDDAIMTNALCVLWVQMYPNMQSYSTVNIVQNTGIRHHIARKISGIGYTSTKPYIQIIFIEPGVEHWLYFKLFVEFCTLSNVFDTDKAKSAKMDILQMMHMCWVIWWNMRILTWNPEVILCMHPANERRRYIATSSMIGWAHIQYNPWESNDHSEFLEVWLRQRIPDNPNRHRHPFRKLTPSHTHIKPLKYIYDWNRVIRTSLFDVSQFYSQIYQWRVMSYSRYILC